MRMPSMMRTLPLRQRAEFNAAFTLQHYARRSPVVGAARERARMRIVEELRRGGPGRAIPVDRVRDITPEQFRSRYLHHGVPVVMEGAAAEWACTKRWSFDDWRSRFGAEDIELVDRPGLTDEEYVDARELSEKMNFGAFLDQVESGGRKYMRFSPLFERFPALADDVNWDWLRAMPDRSFGLNAQLFVGGAGSRTGLHNAMTVFLFVNVVGVKRWTFVPNHYLAVLDPPTHARGYNSSDALIEAPNLERYPGLDSVDYLEAVLNPGDVLFNPSWNWHSVRNDSATIGIRFGMIRPSTMLLESPTLAFLRAFGGRHEGVPLATSLRSAGDAAMAILRQLTDRKTKVRLGGRA